VDGWRFGCALCIEIQFPEVFLEYGARDIDCVLFSAYADEPMFGIQAQGYAASHSVWFSVSVPAQMSHGLCSRLIAPTGEVQGAAPPLVSGLVLNRLDADDPQWKIALEHARPWRAKARDGAIDRKRQVKDPRSEEKSRF
jgi:hypothetical protein